MPGPITPRVEIVQISPFGIWLAIDDREHFLDIDLDLASIEHRASRGFSARGARRVSCPLRFACSSSRPFCATLASLAMPRGNLLFSVAMGDKRPPTAPRSPAEPPRTSPRSGRASRARADAPRPTPCAASLSGTSRRRWGRAPAAARPSLQSRGRRRRIPPGRGWAVSCRPRRRRAAPRRGRRCGCGSSRSGSTGRRHPKEVEEEIAVSTA